MRWSSFLLVFFLMLPFVGAYQGFSDPVTGFSSIASVQFAAGESSRSIALSVSDDVIYRTGYYSFGGSDHWVPFNFSEAATGSWITSGLATVSLGVPASSSVDNYVLVYSCSRGLSWDCHGGQWQIRQFTTGVQTSLAKIVGVSASAMTEGYPPELTLDGDIVPPSYWAGEFDGAWIAYEFNETATIDYIDIAFYKGDERHATFSIETSSDGIIWLRVLNHTRSRNDTLDLQRFSFTPIEAKYLRIVGHGNDGAYPTWNSYTEVRIDDLAVMLDPVQDGNNSDDGRMTYWKQDFEHRAAVRYESAEIKADWNGAGGWRSTEEVFIEEEDGNKFLRNYFYADALNGDAGFSLAAGGIDWYMFLPDQSLDELYVSYRMRFSDNMATEYESSGGSYPKHWLSGKAGPGFYTRGTWSGAGYKPQPGEDAFFVLTMFDGGYPRDSSAPDKLRVKFYVYHLDMVCPAPDPHCWGNSYPVDYLFSPDTWYDITVHIVLNDPGLANGVLEYFVDGKLITSYGIFRFRDNDGVRIQKINMANFLGGSGSAPYVDGWWAFDDFEVYGYG